MAACYVMIIYANYYAVYIKWKCTTLYVQNLQAKFF